MAKLTYKELLKEINDDVDDGVLTSSDTIQILRGDTPVFENYYPIVDWYYDAFIMKEELETPLEEIYLPEEFDADEWKAMQKEKEELRTQYLADQSKLIPMTVKNVITEMKQISKLIK